MSTEQSQTIDPDALPEAITRYLDAHRVRDTDTALGSFRPDATVTDDGRTHRGAEAIRTWLSREASQYTYTTELTRARKTGPDHYVATQRLEGDFPGGVVDLHYRFALVDGRIGSLVIEP
ncbi:MULTISPECIES: nuclear transport factor 2 family protein [unclassified Streptomyces]|jgi:ketosteroid isomerase-like protein|uniref:nuclear transport factor 2 family protein n=1 Tax=unclassified Streptomyces TaxID=2593676 RepID=UPI00331DC2D3